MPTLYDTFVAEDQVRLGANISEYPDVAKLTSGGFVAVWQSHGAAQIQVFDRDGAPVGDVVTTMGPAPYSSVHQPSVSGLADGGFVVAWEGTHESWAQVFDAAAAPIGPPVSIQETPAGTHQQAEVAGLAGGGFVAIWTDSQLDGSGSAIAARLFDASGAPIAGEFVVNTDAFLNQIYPKAATLADGGFVVTWQGTDLSAQFFNADGTRRGGEIAVGETGTVHEVAALANGNAVVVWAASFAGDNTELYAQIFEPDGDAVGSAFPVNYPTSVIEMFPSIGALDDGGFVIAWKQDTAEINYFQKGDIYAQAFAADGARVGEQILVNQLTADGEDDPQVVGFGSGDFAVLWRDLGLGTYTVEMRNFYSATVLTDGNDTFGGTGERDFVFGTGGDDQLSGGPGADVLDGGAGVDTLAGGAGDDVYYVDDANDAVVEAAGEGTDTVVAATSYALAAGTEVERLETDLLAGTAAIALTGNGFANTLVGNYGDNQLAGGEGNDTIEGFGGIDLVAGGSGDDTLILANRVDATGTLTAFTGAGGSYAGGDGIDTLSIGGEVEFAGTLSGIEGVFLQTGNEIWPPSTPGMQQVALLKMDTAHFAMLPSDAFFGGVGVVYLDLQPGESFDFSNYVLQDGSDILFFYDGAAGAPGALATWAGTASRDLFRFGSDTVTVTGGGGDDVYLTGFFGEEARNATITDFTPGEDRLDVSASGIGSFEIVSDFLTQVGSDVLLSWTRQGVTTQVLLEGLALDDLDGGDFVLADSPAWPVHAQGTESDDILIGSSEADWLSGGGGNDRLYSGGQPASSFFGPFDAMYGDDGDDTIILDAQPSYYGGTYDGGAGFDTLEFRIPFGNFLTPSTITGIERLSFASRNEAIYASFSLSQIASAGITHLIGGEGTDLLFLAAGTSPGTYTMPFFSIANWDATIDPDFLHDQVTLGASGSGNFVLNAREGLASTQVLFGSAGNDTLNGSSGSERLDGYDGVNVLNGNGGNDILTIRNSTDSFGVIGTRTGAGSIFDGGSGFDMLSVGGPVTFQGTLIGIEAIHLAAAFDSGALNDAFDQPAAFLVLTDAMLDTLPGNLQLSGSGTIAVYLAPGDVGDASGFVHAAGSTVLLVFNGTSGGDTMLGSGGNELLNGADGDDTLHGGAGLDALGGGAGNDALFGGADADYLLGGDGIDTLDGGAGADRLAGGAGDDSYWVDDAGDLVAEAAGEGADRLFAHASFELAPDAEVEVLQTADAAGTAAIDLYGNGIANALYGNAGGNVLAGNGGGDYVVGLGGHDTLYGGDGADALDGGAGHDVLLGGDGADYLLGGEGNDLFQGDAGIDTLVGGLGDDSYFVDGTGDLIVEAAGEGFDRVISTGSFELAAASQVEVLQLADLAGTSAFSLYGSDIANSIYGNAGGNVLAGLGGDDYLVGLGGHDTLYGGAGVDAIDGGAGSDVLFGGAGADYLVGGADGDYFAFFDALGGGNVDQIADMAAGSDKIALDDAVFTGLPTGALAASAFVAGTAAGDADDRVIYDGASGQLWFDADGSGAGAAVLFATVGPALALTSADFVVF